MKLRLPFRRPPHSIQDVLKNSNNAEARCPQQILLPGPGEYVLDPKSVKFGVCYFFNLWEVARQHHGMSLSHVRCRFHRTPGSSRRIFIPPSSSMEAILRGSIVTDLQVVYPVVFAVWPGRITSGTLVKETLDTKSLDAAYRQPHEPKDSTKCSGKTL